ncbi:MAG TPA: hypothetical protein VGO31_03050 [Microbacteriaceae bacterium]|jgi:Tol biopolymer transport system component|nr:hypothetical protein [Microbacteriaceae bacterium]
MKLVVAVSVALALAAAVASIAHGEFILSAVWTVRDDGSARQILAVLPSGVVIDRAGDRVALSTDEGLVVARLDAGGHVVFPDTKNVGSAVFSPSSNSIAFTAWANGSYGLYVARADGTAVRRADVSASPAAWSLDGRSIVFASGVVGKRADLVTERVDGSGRRVLARGGFSDLLRPPYVSPDGRSIAYDCANTQGGGFCIVRDRTTRRYLHGGFDPVWSPTGRLVATTIIGNLNSGLDVVDVATGARRVVAPVPDLIGVDFTPLAWSPDGRRLLYQRRCGAGLRPPQCVTAVYVRTITTGKDRRISVDGLRWTLAQWRGHTVTYVTQP